MVMFTRGNVMYVDKPSYEALKKNTNGTPEGTNKWSVGVVTVVCCSDAELAKLEDEFHTGHSNLNKIKPTKGD